MCVYVCLCVFMCCVFEYRCNVDVYRFVGWIWNLIFCVLIQYPQHPSKLEMCNVMYKNILSTMPLDILIRNVVCSHHLYACRVYHPFTPMLIHLTFYSDNHIHISYQIILHYVLHLHTYYIYNQTYYIRIHHS